MNNMPYLAGVLNIPDAWRTDTQQARLKVATVDYHLKEQIKVRGWSPTTQAYRDLIKEASKELKISKHIPETEVLHRLYYYFHLKKLAYG